MRSAALEAERRPELLPLRLHLGELYATVEPHSGFSCTSSSVARQFALP